MNRYVIAYDIPDDARRVKLARLLDGYGDRVQYSVFEALVEENDLPELKERVAGLIDPKTDRVRMYFICGACATKIEDIGQQGGKPFDSPDVIIL